ncbi:hypothetical protein SUGI_0506790 [Cryptomeria japonica]|uniref:F-box protein GID2 n=1 Tax=Cryptomeria japonica TaxID=3369 RepID=UPI002408B9BC|nr:F-box protein GID2 [Cryptomeria japonica]GLJ26329.1 hypothetical protein SUGI_0506790 [Cryptomeria japonica]
MGTECRAKEKRAKLRAAVMDGIEGDILFEVLKHLDSKSLSMAACVSRRWKRMVEEEALWEGICTKYWPMPMPMGPQITCVVRALGGFRRFYIHCLRPLLKSNIKCASFTKDHFNLSLSLFSIDCYERLGRRSGTPTSLKFLCSKHRFSSCSASFPLHKTALPPPSPPPPPPPPPPSAARAL